MEQRNSRGCYSASKIYSFEKNGMPLRDLRKESNMILHFNRNHYVCFLKMQIEGILTYLWM
jgi:hypothetical protein